MVNSSSNRSPSPISMRSNPNPNPNPNSRNDQEREGVGVRKSISGYPFAKSSIVAQPRSFTPNTPANSPAEYARRSSFGRECGAGIGDHEQKENERDPNLKPIARARSPSVLKGTKNFMSPTISAASKINPSPRKKVLGERNEAIRTSASLSDGKFHFFSTNSLDFTDENESKSDVGTPPFSMISDFNKVGNEVSNTEFENNVADVSPVVGKIESESDMVVLSPEIPLNFTAKSPETSPQSEMPKVVVDNNVGLDTKKNTSSSPSVIAPLDADPFHSPYDPKTNFLSPRPQFLHYKPNPRIESYINQGVRLEDDFSSDSVSEAENSDEVQSETSQEVQEETSSSAEPLSLDSSSPKSEELDEIVESKIEPKPRFSGKWKAVTFLFFILLGSISFSMYYPGVGNAINQEKVLSQIYSSSRSAAYLAKDNFDVLFLNAKVLSAQSVGYLSQVIFKEREIKYSPLPFNNLSGWQEEEVEDDYLVKGFEFKPWLGKEVGADTAMKKAAETVIFDDETELRKLDDCEVEILEQSSAQVVEEEYEPEILEESSVVEDSVYEDDVAVIEMTEEALLSDEPEKIEKTSVPENENSAVEMNEGASLLDESENQEAEHNLAASAIHDESQSIKVEDQTSSSSPGPEVHSQVHDEPPSVKVEDQTSSSSSGPEVHSQVSTANVPFNDVELSSEERVEDKSVSRGLIVEGADRISQILEASERSLAPITAAISLVVFSLLAATVFKFVKQSKKETSTVSAPSADDHHVVQKEHSSFIPIAKKIDPKVRENPPSLSGPVEVDMIGESCPSELSSFQKTSSYYKKTDPRGSDEAQSVEKNSKRNHKRESFASSSSEYTTMGSSYGSFTTYSIVHSTQLDDEVVTPIRRSSRIRSKVTSP